MHEGTASRPIRVNLGSGAHLPEGWIHVDNSLGATLAQWPHVLKILHAMAPRRLAAVMPSPEWTSRCTPMDLTRRFGFADTSVDHVYSSHLVEHLTRDEARHVLRECHRILRSGGIVRIVVPDFGALVSAYLADREARPAEASEIFHSESWFFHQPPPRRLRDLPLYYARRRHNHRFVPDDASLRADLHAAGFRDVAPRILGDSAIPGILEVEIEDRFRAALCLEGVKP